MNKKLSWSNDRQTSGYFADYILCFKKSGKMNNLEKGYKQNNMKPEVKFECYYF